jgi:hypothetical protein
MHLLPYTAVMILINIYVSFKVIITVCLIVFRVVILVYVVFYVNSTFPFPNWLVLVIGKMLGGFGVFHPCILLSPV